MQSNPIFPVTDRFPQIRENREIDIAIIGAGIVGISCAYFLQKAGYKVTVLEEDEVGSAASGASSGILYYGSGTNLTEAIQLYGKKSAEALWNETRQTIIEIKKLIKEEKLSANLREPGAIMVAQNESETQYLKNEQSLLDNIGIKTELLDTAEIKKFFTGKKFLVGLHIPEVAQISPAIFAASLAQRFNIPVFEKSPYLSHEETETAIAVKTPKATILCKKILFATNLKPLFNLEKEWQEESSVILASTPMSDDKLKAIWPQEKIIWTTGNEYDIIYPEANRFILEIYKLKRAKDKIPQYYPQHFTIDKQYGDSWAKTKNGLPIVRKLKDNIYAAVAMGDEGIVMGWTTARTISKLIQPTDGQV